VPEGAVNLPTPEQERLAATVLLAWLVLGVIGIVTVIGGGAALLFWAARWVFSGAF
jgi:hypothetical protein